MRRIGLVLTGFILGVVLSHWQQSVRAQDEHPAHELSVKELLAILADFDIRHEAQRIYSGRPAYGVTVFDADPPTIYIFNAQTHDSKMSTLIHEFVHVRCARLQVECTDDYVAMEEAREYQALFGVQ